MVSPRLGCWLGVLVTGRSRARVSREGADLAALAGSGRWRRRMTWLFEPAVFADAPIPLHLVRDAYLELRRRAAEVTAARDGRHDVVMSFPDATSFAPVRIRVAVRERIDVP